MTRTSAWADVLPGRRRAGELAAALESGRLPADPELTQLVGLARALVPAEHAPSSAFRAQLRARLVEEATTRPVVVPAPRDPAPQRHLRPRVRRTAAVLATLSVVAGTGATAASSQALPGDPLYGLKRGVEGAQLALARDDLGRGRELLEQAGARVSEAQRLAAGGAGTAQVAATLDAYDVAVDAGALALAASYRETGAEEPLLLLAGFVADQLPLLVTLRDGVDPTLRDRLQEALDALAVLQVRTDAVLGQAGAGGTAGVSSARLVGSQLVANPLPRRTETPSPDVSPRGERQATGEQRSPEAGTGGAARVEGRTVVDAGARPDGGARIGGDAGTTADGPSRGADVSTGTGQVDADVDTGTGQVGAGTSTGTGPTASVPAAPAPAPAFAATVPAPTPLPAVTTPAAPSVEAPAAQVPPVDVEVDVDVPAPCLPTDPGC